MARKPVVFDQDKHGAIAPQELRKAQDVANLLDTAIRIPVVGIPVGLDFLVGLIPGVGDAAMLVAALRIVYLGKKMGAPEALQSKMLRNVLLDFGLGFIPVVGDIADLFYKANRKNVRLLERWWIENNKAEVDSQTADKLAEWEEKMKSLEDDEKR
ncbi:DUF4112 domain-containing protein [Alteromonas oceanisediminis]|uniref:DUF4112 domain-containing protein n=1 Tax=Alteromonas oceanisediminis TaxID=2836180 RepID=UPI001BDB58DC|nr:DUF4112 domain-containing protein [Alteromonas oceanisediminis]MBT0586944.1 DUF4112 domain-containing protein [Alteromonas oceanisediminis]